MYFEGRYIKPNIVIYLDDTPFMKEQKLEIAWLGDKRKICELNFFNVKTGKADFKRPRGQNKKKYLQKVIDAFITKVKKGEFTLDKPIKTVGNKSNMNFVYGENIERKDRISQFAVDFNGTRRLVKEISL